MGFLVSLFALFEGPSCILPIYWRASLGVFFGDFYILLLLIKKKKKDSFKNSMSKGGLSEV